MRKAIIRGLLFAFLVLGFSVVLSTPASAQFAVGISVGFAPPALPVYEQPVCPGDGYIWTPGYWAWDDSFGDYYWVPGTWVQAPQVGFFWTPAYWGWGGDAFVFYPGYWGPQVGFYGGINYGFGYFGTGFVGGRWDSGRFYYNRSVSNVNVTEIHNVYNESVTNVNVNHVSYNGGNGGINARPTAQEESFQRSNHTPPVAAQVQQAQQARGNPELRASTNHGKPPIAATARPGAFTGGEVVKAREAGGNYNPPANRGNTTVRTENNNPGERTEIGSAARVEPNAAPRTYVHPNDVPAYQRPSAPNTGNPKTNQKYQQQQDKLAAQQAQDRQKLQQKQDQQHAQLQKQNADTQRTQQLEQRHQQQTQQMVQKHTQQQQQLQTRQASRAPAPPPAQHESEQKH
jgi:WXXGXW repeat (2 copies)